MKYNHIQINNTNDKFTNTQSLTKIKLSVFNENIFLNLSIQFT